MKKYMLLGISVWSMALDISISAGYIGLGRDIYSLGVAQGIDLGNLPIELEVGADPHYHNYHVGDKYDDCVNDYYREGCYRDGCYINMPFLPRVTMSAYVKALFPFSKVDSFIVGHSLHGPVGIQELYKGGIIGYRRQVSDTQSFQLSFESIEASNERHGCLNVGDDYKLAFTATKSFK